MQFDLRELWTKHGIVPLTAIGAGIFWLTEQFIQNALSDLFSEKGWHMMPYVLLGIGLVWAAIVVTRGPRFIIIFEPTDEPFKHEWTDDAGHHILFRIEVRNLCQFKSIDTAIVRATKLEPYSGLDVLPMELLQMNDCSLRRREFFLPAGGSQFIDIFHQTEGKDLWLWHVNPQFTKTIKPIDYTVTIGAYGNNAKPVFKTFKYEKRGSVWAMNAV